MRECDSVLYYIVTAYMHMMMLLQLEKEAELDEVSG